MHGLFYPCEDINVNVTLYVYILKKMYFIVNIHILVNKRYIPIVVKEFSSFLTAVQVFPRGNDISGTVKYTQCINKYCTC